MRLQFKINMQTIYLFLFVLLLLLLYFLHLKIILRQIIMLELEENDCNYLAFIHNMHLLLFSFELEILAELL